MAKNRNIINALTSITSILLPLKYLINTSHQKLLLPVYHTISDKNLIHIKNLYKVKTEQQFIRDLDFILKYYKPIDLKKLIKIHKKDIKVNEPVFHLSFDDGLSEFYNVITPLLFKKGIPATCFLNSAFIDNNDLFFRYKESIIVDNLTNKKYDATNLKGLNEILRIKESSIAKLNKIILGIKYDQRELIEDIANLFNIDFKEFLKKNKPYLSKEQIKELQKKGFTFGAHSIDHPEYRYIPIEEQINQTVQSINELKKMFDLNYSVFAFPFTDTGVSKEFFNIIKKQVNPDLTFACSGIKRDIIKTNLHRIPIEDSSVSAKRRIKSEYIYYLLKKPLNKNVFHRN